MAFLFLFTPYLWSSFLFVLFNLKFYGIALKCDNKHTQMTTVIKRIIHITISDNINKCIFY